MQTPGERARERRGNRNARIVRRARLGHLYKYIAADEGLSVAWVSHIAKTTGYTRPPAEPCKTERNARIVRRARAGEHYYDIAADEDITSERVRQIATRAGYRRAPRASRLPKGVVT